MRKNSALAHLLTKFLLQRIQRFQGSLLRLKVFWDFPMRLGELLRLSYLDKNYSNREKLQECTHFEKAYPFPAASLFLEPSIIFNCHLQQAIGICMVRTMQLRTFVANLLVCLLLIESPIIFIRTFLLSFLTTNLICILIC